MTQLYVFEGGDGSGKTTQIHAVAGALKERGYSVLVTRQPGGTEVGQEIRRILKNPQYFDDLPSLSRRLLFQVDAIAHQAFMKGSCHDVILCDRLCAVSNEAYGPTEGCNINDVADAERFGALENMFVTLMFILNVDPRVGWDRTDHEDLSDQTIEQCESVNRQYQSMAKCARKDGVIETFGGTVIPTEPIDANGTREETTKLILAVIDGSLITKADAEGFAEEADLS